MNKPNTIWLGGLECTYETRFFVPEKQGQEKKYFVDWDKQPRAKTDGSNLVQSLRETGLMNLPVFVIGAVLKMAIDILLRGHRRTHALWQYSQQFEGEFKERFPNGVPYICITGVWNAAENKQRDITLLEADLIRADHDEDSYRESLTSKREAYRLTCPLFEEGLTETEVMKRTWRTVARIFSAENFKKIAREADLVTTDERLTPKEKDEKIWNTRDGKIGANQRGNFQKLHQLSILTADIVEHWLDKKDRVEGAIDITDKDIEKLAKVMREETADSLKAVGQKTYNKSHPGPKYAEAVKQFLASLEHKEDESKSSGDKMMKKKDIEAFLGTLTSADLKLPVQAILGNEGALTAIKTTDPMVARIETAYTKNASLMDAFISKLILGDETEITRLQTILEPVKKNGKKNQ